MALVFIVGFMFGIISAALFAEWVRFVEKRKPKIPHCPNIPAPPLVRRQ